MVYKETLEGIGVKLRPIEERDAEFTYKLRHDKDRTKYIHYDKGTVEDQRKFIKEQREREGDYYFIVEDNKGCPIGALAYYKMDGKNGEMGRMVLNGTYSQNCDAILQLRRFAFEIIGADYTRCTVVKGNKPVIAQIKRLGGIQTGSFIDEIDGSEVLEYRVSKEAYEKRKEKYRRLVERSYELGEM